MSGWRHEQGNRHQRGYGTAWEKLRRAVLERDRWLCQCETCKRTGRAKLAHEVDHVIPKAQGGSDSLSNLQAINRRCHQRKTIVDAGGTPARRIGLDGFPLE